MSCGWVSLPSSTSSAVREMRMETYEYSDPSGRDGSMIQLPAPTAWPIVLAIGITLVFAGVVTNADISVLGAVLLVSGCVGWFHQVLPHESEETVPVHVPPEKILATHQHVEHIEFSERHRAYLPIETYPVKAGIKGG